MSHKKKTEKCENILRTKARLEDCNTNLKNSFCLIVLFQYQYRDMTTLRDSSSNSDKMNGLTDLLFPGRSDYCCFSHIRKHHFTTLSHKCLWIDNVASAVPVKIILPDRLVNYNENINVSKIVTIMWTHVRTWTRALLNSTSSTPSLKGDSP